MSGLSLRLAELARLTRRRRRPSLRELWRRVVSLVYRTPVYRLALTYSPPPEIAGPWSSARA